MTPKKIILPVLLLLILTSCENKNYLAKQYGKVNPDHVIRIEYYKSEDYRVLSPNKKPTSIISEKAKIEEIVDGINYSNNPGPWKGVSWDKIIIVKNDTTLTYSTNGKVIRQNQGKGSFYELQDELFIERHFGKH